MRKSEDGHLNRVVHKRGQVEISLSRESQGTCAHVSHGVCNWPGSRSNSRWVLMVGVCLESTGPSVYPALSVGMAERMS